MTQETNIPIDPHSQEIKIAYQWNQKSRWHETYLSMTEWKDVMNSGLLDGKSLATVKIFMAEEDDLGTSNLIYDFSLAKAGALGWRLE